MVKFKFCVHNDRFFFSVSTSAGALTVLTPPLALLLVWVHVRTLPLGLGVPGTLGVNRHNFGMPAKARTGPGAAGSGLPGWVR